MEASFNAALPCSGVHVNSLWLHRLVPRPQAAARLFCFPYAGASAATYRLWPSALPETLEVIAVQLPGRGSRLREPAIASISALVDALIPVLRPHMDLPFAFFGHSMGALLACEVARALTIGGGPLPKHLVVSSRRAPHVSNFEPLMHRLPDAEFLSEINRRYGGIPPEILEHTDVLELLLPGLRADITALETFLPSTGVTLECPITALGGTEDRLTPREHLEAWRGVTNNAFKVRTFPGGHFYLDSHRGEVLAELALTFATMLTAARSSEAMS